MLRSLATSLSLAATLACDSVENKVELRWAGDTLLASLSRLTSADSEVDSTVSVLFPLYVRHAEGHSFVADAARDRIAVLDSQGRVRSWIGTPGRGPGELAGVSRIATRGRSVLVAEARNGRVSEFAFDGRFLGTFVAPSATGALSATQDRVIIAIRSTTHHAAELRRGRPPTPFLRRTSRAAPGRWSNVTGQDLIAADDAGVWVFDQTTGALCAFETNGRERGCRILPSTLLRRLRAYRDARVAALERGTGLRVTAAPLAKDLQVVAARLIMLLPLPELPVLLVDPADGSLTLVLHSFDSLPSWARRATGLSWDGRGLLLVSDEGIGRLTLTPF